MPRFSRHALQRLQDRGITREEVSSVLNGPEVTFSDQKGNPCRVREINGRRIKVVTSQTDPNFVITVIDLDAP
jgi:hypothetical protein